MMDIAGIGVQTISTTTGTAAQNPNPAPAPAVGSDQGDASEKRVNASPTPGTGAIVDKTV